MSDTYFTRSDLCSINAAAGQAELADAVRGIPSVKHEPQDRPWRPADGAGR
jgi:hypothetical protein